MASIYGYLRVSTDGQKNSGVGDAAQNASVTKQWVELFRDKGFPSPPVIFSDPAVSAGKVEFSRRPGGGELCLRLSRGDVLILPNLDRAFRDIRDQINQLHEWDKAGVRIFSGDMWGMQFDNSTLGGKMMLTIMGLVAEAEYKRICDRNQARVKACKASGRASTRRPWGFINHPVKGVGKLLHPNDQERKMMRWALRASVNGWKLTRILATLNAQGFVNILGKPLTKTGTFELIEREVYLQSLEKKADLAATDDAPFGWYVTPDGVRLPRLWKLPENCQEKQSRQITVGPAISP